MKSLGESLKHYLDSPLKNKVAHYIHERFLPDYELSVVLERLDKFHVMLESIPQGVDVSYTAVVDRSKDEIENDWEVFLVKKEEGSRYATDFIPFAQLMRYPVEGDKTQVDVIGDIIWDLTFDGWTEEERNERIKEFEESLEE